MQKSTDTLVDESGFINSKKLYNEKMINSPLNGTKKTSIEDGYEEDDLFDLNNRHTANSSSRLNCFRHGSNGSLVLLAQKSSFSTSTAETSTTPLSSSIPSPASFTIHNNFRKHSANNSNNGLNTVSTSTSGLSDYVASAKFRIINDKIKYFNDNNFNDSNENKIFKSNDLIESNDLDQRLKTSENLNGKRLTSNSIPIVKKNVKKIFLNFSVFDFQVKITPLNFFLTLNSLTIINETRKRQFKIVLILMVSPKFMIPPVAK